MTKRFEVHSMIQGMNIGETMDLECCKELIEKYGSSIDIDLLITDNGKDMTYRQVCDLLNENEELKGDVEYWKNRFKEEEWHYEHIDEDRDVWHYKCTQLEKENEQLYELIDFANTLIVFKTSESCQKEWEKRLKELIE